MSEPIPAWAARLYGELAVRNIELEQKMADLGDAVSQVTDVLAACEDRIRAQDQEIAQLRDHHDTTVTENDATVSQAADELLARLVQTRALLAEAEPDPAAVDPAAPADPAAVDPAVDPAAPVDPSIPTHAEGDHSGDFPLPG